jgi:hypothetical protein
MNKPANYTSPTNPNQNWCVSLCVCGGGGGGGGGSCSVILDERIRVAVPLLHHPPYRDTTKLEVPKVVVHGADGRAGPILRLLCHLVVCVAWFGLVWLGDGSFHHHYPSS